MQTKIYVAGNRLEIERGLISGASLYTIAGLDYSSHHLLLELDDDRDIPLAATDSISIGGNERFSIGDGTCPADSNPALRTPIRPVINEKKLTVEEGLLHAKLTFQQLARLDPHFEVGDGVFLDIKDVPDAQILPDMVMLVQKDDRFYTSPCGNVGFQPLLEQHLLVLREKFSNVDAVNVGPVDYIVVRDVPLGPQWSRALTDVLVQVPQGYPLSAMDMFWVPPGLCLADGTAAKNADLVEVHLDQPWQRFSWHYPPGYRWNPVYDGLVRHMRFVQTRLNMFE